MFPESYEVFSIIRGLKEMKMLPGGPVCLLCGPKSRHRREVKREMETQLIQMNMMPEGKQN